MKNTNEHSWARSLLRPTPRRLVVFAIFVALWCVYLMYFTHQKRAVRHRLSEADTKSKQAIDVRLKPLADLFAKGRQGSKAFASDALSWKGKWKCVKEMVAGGDSHRRFLAESFARHVFSPEELRLAMEAVVQSYLDDIEGYEGEMLVHLRADLADTDRPTELLPPHLRGNEEFEREYKRLASRVTDELHLDLGMNVGREAGLLVVSEIAAQVALQAAKAAATEMGVNAGILSSGVVSGIATLGVGIVIGIILDYVIDEVFKLAGYDPEAKIESLVCDSINRMEAALLRDSSGWFTREKKGSLRLQMEQLHESRSKLRRETIKKFIKEGGLK